MTAAAAMAEVRDLRQRQRTVERPTSRSVGRPKGAKSTPWFSAKHPLAKTVRRLCDHRGRKKVGTIGCGPCWEQAIREAACGATGPPEDEYDVDEAVVQRVLAGDYRVPCNPAEKAAIIHRWTAGGRHINELARLTGWKPERYFQVAELLEATS